MEKEEERRQDSRRRKLCFVTIGATASFNALLEAVLNISFLEALSAADYTDLLVQYGRDEGRDIFESFLRRFPPGSDELRRGLDVRGFGFNKNGLTAEMTAAKGQSGSLEGVVVSHAGSGSILDALRIDVPLIVVPNETLLDNHQVELAEELARQGYVVHGKIRNLPAAITASEILRKKKKQWPPVTSKSRGLKGVLDDEMGFLD